MAGNKLKSALSINPIGRLKDAGLGFLKLTKNIFVHTAGGLMDTMKMVKNRGLNLAADIRNVMSPSLPWRKKFDADVEGALRGLAK